MDRATLARLVAGALPHWGIEATDARPLADAENVSVLVMARGGERFVLRVHRPGLRSAAELASEHAWMAALALEGLPVPLPRPSLDGRGHVPVPLPDWAQPRVVSVCGWLPGEPLGAHLTSGAPARFAALGALMARMHEVAAGWAPPPGFVRPRWDAEGLMGQQPRWGRFWEHPALTASQAELLDRARLALHARMVGRERDVGTLLVHADLTLGNVLVDGSALRILDFDDCGYADPAYDMAVALYQMRTNTCLPELRAALLDGYRSVRLPPCGDEELPLYTAARAFASLGWVAQRPGLPAADVQRLIRGCEAMARAALAGGRS